MTVITHLPCYPALDELPHWQVVLATMQTFLAITLALIFAFLPLVSAHGYVKAIAIDGQWYAGNQPNNYKGLCFGSKVCVLLTYLSPQALPRFA